MTRIVSELISRVSRRFATAGLVLAVLLAPALSMAQAQPAAKFKVLHRFDYKDGAFPTFAGVITDAAGNLYGTANNGGHPNCMGFTWGCGVLYKLSPTGHETVLHKFTGADGAGPWGNLLLDSNYNLYGTTSNGGNVSACDSSGCGVVFKLDSSGHETVLYAFQGGADGANPAAGLIQDTAGNLYGTTSAGGTSGNGVVFKLDPKDNFTVLYAFTGGDDGSTPLSSLILDSAGNLYGTTSAGGTSGNGVVFKLDSSNQETVLYAFTGGTDGASPESSVVQDSKGNLYGTTPQGGDNGYGVVYKLNKKGQESVLHSFNQPEGGAYPVGGVAFDASGNIYGDTWLGGNLGLCGGTGCGVIFKLAKTGKPKYTVLHRFTDGADGGAPTAAVLIGPNSELYLTTTYGGNTQSSGCSPKQTLIGCGTVVQFTF